MLGQRNTVCGLVCLVLLAPAVGHQDEQSEHYSELTTMHNDTEARRYLRSPSSIEKELVKKTEQIVRKTTEKHEQLMKKAEQKKRAEEKKKAKTNAAAMNTAEKKFRWSPWTPELVEHRSMKTGVIEKDAIRKILMNEMQRSLNAYPANTKVDEAWTLLSDLARTRLADLVIIYNGRLFVHNSFLTSGDAHTRKLKCRHLQFVFVALKSEHQHLRNVVYAYSRFPHYYDRQQDLSIGQDSAKNKKMRKNDDTPLIKCGKDRLPELVEAKPQGYNQCGILIPNVHYMEPVPHKDYTGPRLTKSMRMRDAVKTFESRFNNATPKAYWHGAVADVPSDRLEHCGYARDFARARLQVLALGRASSKYFITQCDEGRECIFYDEPTCAPVLKDRDASINTKNIKLSNSRGKNELVSFAPSDIFNKSVVEPRLSALRLPTRRREVETSTALKLKDAVRAIATENPELHTGHPLRPTTIPRKYKYRIGVPFEWNLNNIWFSGQVVLLWNLPLVEWYYPALQHGVTHLAIDIYTAESMINELIQNNANITGRLRRNALKLHNYVFCPDCTIAYFAHVVNSFRSHFYLESILDDDQLRNQWFREFLGSWSSQLLEIKFGTQLDMVSIYREESYSTVLRKMIASTESSDSLMFHRTVGGNSLSEVTNWRLHDWRPELNVYTI